MSSKPTPSKNPLWSRLEFPFGYPDAIDKLGTTAAPLLAGFAFTLIALTLDKKSDIWNPDLSLLLLVIASIALISSVQFNFNARRYYVSVADYFDLTKLEKEDGIQAGKAKELAGGYLESHKTWAGRSRVAYNLGVSLLFVAVAATLIPPEGIGHMPPLRVASTGALAAAGLVEALLVLIEAGVGIGGWLKDRRGSGKL